MKVSATGISHYFVSSLSLPSSQSIPSLALKGLHEANKEVTSLSGEASPVLKWSMMIYSLSAEDCTCSGEYATALWSIKELYRFYVLLKMSPEIYFPSAIKRALPAKLTANFKPWNPEVDIMHSLLTGDC